MLLNAEPFRQPQILKGDPSVMVQVGRSYVQSKVSVAVSRLYTCQGFLLEVRKHRLLIQLFCEMSGPCLGPRSEVQDLSGCPLLPFIGVGKLF